MDEVSWWYPADGVRQARAALVEEDQSTERRKALIEQRQCVCVPSGNAPIWGRVEPMNEMRRWLALGGIVGPGAFIAAWSILGAGRAGYSPIHDPISELAAIDTSSRATMTAGFVAFGAGVGIYAPALRAALPGGAAAAAALSAAGTLGVAVTPLGSSLGGTPHATAAALAYSGLALSPLLGARSLARVGRRREALVATVIGVTAGVALCASVLLTDGTGLAQRAGLTMGDAWIVATAAAILREHGPSSTKRTRRR